MNREREKECVRECVYERVRVSVRERGCVCLGILVVCVYVWGGYD